MYTKGILTASQGVTRARFEALRNDIIQCLALVEALIDFGEGEDIEEGVYDQGSSIHGQMRTQMLTFVQLENAY